MTYLERLLGLTGGKPKAEDFRAPLDFILAEHYRHRQLCDKLDELTAEMNSGPVAGLAQELLQFLTQDLQLHLQDEEQDLFPLLRRRCQPEDEIDDILNMLSEEHALDRDLVDFLIEDLKVLANGQHIANSIRFLVNVREFASTQRRHLAWENAMLLPIARRKLEAMDLSDLGRRMAARRGIHLD